MTFHRSQWGFRAAAARLFLAPVITGLVAGGAAAQAPARTQQVAPRSADPKELLKQGRDALKAGQFDQAVDLAKRADANNSTGRWGLFDDTPESLEKDIAAGRVKAGKVEGEKLAKAAKELYAKPTRTPGERIANLDQAYQLADKAQALCGPSDFFDDVFGGSDRPEKLKKDIDAARAAVRKANPGVVTAAATKPAGGSMASGITQAGATAKPNEPNRVVTAGAVLPPPNMPALPTPATAVDRQNATKLVSAARDALRVGKYAEAKDLAQKARAADPASADAADAVARDAAAAGKAQVDKLTKDAAALAAANDTPKAQAALADAKALAAGLGFQTKPIDDQLARLSPPAGGVTAPVLPNAGVAAVTIQAPDLPGLGAPAALPDLPAPVRVVETQTKTVGLEPTPGGVLPRVVTTETKTVAVDAPGAPSLPSVGLPPIPPPGAAALPAPPTVPALPDAAPAAPGVITGEQLLGQARASLRGGDVDMARTLALRAFNAPGANKDDAAAVMREVDAEKYVRTRAEAAATLKNATTAVQQKQYEQALATIKLIDPAGLTAEQQAQAETLARQAAAEMAKTTPAQALTAPTGPTPARPLTGETTPAQAAADIETQKLRSEGLEVERKSREAFNRGETDLAIKMSEDFVAKVKASPLPSARQAQIAGSVERKLETMLVMKKRTDFYASEARGKLEARDRTVGKQAAEQQKGEDLKKKSTELTELITKKKYREAEELAAQMHNLDPDNPAVTAMYELAKRQRRVDQQQRLKDGREKMFYDGLTEAETVGPTPTNDTPLIVDPNRSLIARSRGDGQMLGRIMTPIERDIEVKLERPMTVSFKNRPLREVIGDIKAQSGLNITTDDASIQDAQINVDAVTVTEDLRDLSVRNVLEILLDKARLKFVVENNVVRVTTEKRAQGKLITKVFSVMELVTPVPDFALADHQSISKALGANKPNPAWTQTGPGTSTYNPTGGMQGGAELRSDRMAGMPGGVLDPNGADNQAGPMASSATLAKNGRTNHSAQLMKLITAMVKPYSWMEGGGAGKVSYYDIGGALVVNQTADVIGEVQQLLESLRRLQEVSVSVEIRVVSLSESFFERIGVDFALNIKTHKNQQFERSLTTGQFSAEPFINDINVRNVTVGYNPTAGGFTSDLDVPVRPNTYGLGVPPFGGYNGPSNGALGVGLAFLNDIQVFMFMEAASGDRRVNIMQAPKITLFNGQTSTVFVSDFAFFTTGLDVINVGGQFVYIPRNTPIPIGNSPAPPGVQAAQATPGVTVTVQAIVSADRRFVRLNLAPTLTSLTSATVPLFPVTAFITPVFEGGSQGVPIPFTQFFQQPSISEINVQTTVAVPDGGTVVLGGLKTMAEGRNEFGPPVLSQLPYVNRLFRNQGIGRETRHIMIMVTPRIIIQSEEELNQTGGGVGLPGTGGQ